MTGTFGVPPEGDKIAAMVQQRLEQAKKEDGEKLSIEWRGARVHLNVISMPVDMLYYNPDTHRIRAQRTLNSERNAVLESTPWGPEGQEYLDFLLKAQPADPDKIDPDFEALRESLDDFSQQQPGLITHQGILVNGNTRCAALRELGVRYIRVAVLPEDTSRDDINTVELSLQLRRENKRDYSYINQLIAMEEQLAAGRKPDEIAREFHIRTKTLEQDRWVFGVIQEAIQRSRTDDGSSLRLIDFEDHQEKLRELYRAYMNEIATNRDAAETLKESRLAMIVLGFSKTDVRLAKPDFFEKYLVPKLPDSVKPKAVTEGPSMVPGLNIPLPTSGESSLASRALTDDLLRAKAKSQTQAEAGATAIVADVKEAIDRALPLAGKDERLRQRKVAAAERLSDASDLIDLCTSSLAQAVATDAVDEASIDEALTRLRGSLAKLSRQVARAVKEPSEGAAWLLNSTQGAE